MRRGALSGASQIAAAKRDLPRAYQRGPGDPVHIADALTEVVGLLARASTTLRAAGLRAERLALQSEIDVLDQLRAAWQLRLVDDYEPEAWAAAVRGANENTDPETMEVFDHVDELPPPPQRPSLPWHRRRAFVRDVLRRCTTDADRQTVVQLFAALGYSASEIDDGVRLAELPL